MTESADVAAAHDPELIRTVLLHLAKRERAPPEAIFVSPSDLEAQGEASREGVARALDFLYQRGLIEGPGWLEGDFLFRKVTAKGRTLAQAIAHPRDWKAIKAQYLA